MNTWKKWALLAVVGTILGGSTLAGCSNDADDDDDTPTPAANNANRDDD